MEKNMKRKVFKGETTFTLDYSTPAKLQESKTNRHFHQRMLRAYLAGKDKFNFGFKDMGTYRMPISHDVLFAWE